MILKSKNTFYQSIVGSVLSFSLAGLILKSFVFYFQMYACMMLFFICNAVESQLVSTGAFEITVDNMPVWSKLESGRIPQPPELFQIIDNHLQMNSGQGLRGLEDEPVHFHGEL